jgi:hypothetical protein
MPPNHRKIMTSAPRKRANDRQEPLVLSAILKDVNRSDIEIRSDEETDGRPASAPRPRLCPASCDASCESPAWP